jgi:hypothetical protein
MYVITYVYNTQFGYNISSSVVAIRVKLLDDVYVCMDSMMYVCMYVCMFVIQSLYSLFRKIGGQRLPANEDAQVGVPSQFVHDSPLL